MEHYTLEFQHGTADCYCLNLTYSEMPKHSSDVEAALRLEIPAFVGKCDGNILATAWHCPDEETERQIPLRDGNSHLYYRRADGAIFLWTEYLGQASDSKENDDHLAIVSNRETFRGIEPPREWFDVSILFKKPTSALTIYSVLVAMCRDWGDVGIDINAYAFYGERDNRLTWTQINDTDGRFILVNFDAQLNKLSRLGKPLPI
jgi:hypothetical protein